MTFPQGSRVLLHEPARIDGDPGWCIRQTQYRPGAADLARGLAEQIPPEVFSRWRLRRGARNRPRHGERIEIDLNNCVSALLVEAEKLLPRIQVQNQGRPRPGDPVQASAHALGLIRLSTPVPGVEVAFGCVVLIGKIDCLAAAIEDITEDLVPTG